MRNALQWLGELADNAASLPQVLPPRPYYAHPKYGQPLTNRSFPVTVRQVRALVHEFRDERYFGDIFGFYCAHYDDIIREKSYPRVELDRRIGKPDLWDAEPEAWEEEDLYQFIEVSTTSWPDRQEDSTTKVADGTLYTSINLPARHFIGGA